MNKNVGVSVIIPVHNTKAYIRECMDSLVSQTYQDMEIVCVVDHSTDGTDEILKEYESNWNKVRVFYLSEARGAGAARNLGLSKAVGEYVIFLDSDDFFEPAFLEKMYKRAVSKNAEVVLCGAKRFDDRFKIASEAGWYLREMYLPEKEVFSRKDLDGKLFCLTAPSAWTKLLSRKFVLEHHLQFQNLNNANDLYFVYMALSLAERITAVREALVNYRVFREDSLQQKKHREPLCFLEAFEALYDELHCAGIYEDVEKGFCDQFLDTAWFNFDSVKEEEAKWQIARALSSSRIDRMGVLDKKDSYYPRSYNKYKVKGLIYALEQHEKKKEEKKFSYDDIKVLVPSRVEDVKVSVVVPVYQTEKYVQATIDSLLNQTLKEVELICIDDGSEDGSLEILLENAKKDERICVCTQPNAGLAIVRNQGLKLARGKYISFLDSDDCFEKQGLEILYNHGEQYDTDVICFNGKVVYEDEDLKQKHAWFEYFYDRKGDYPEIGTGAELLSALRGRNEYRSNVGLLFFNTEFLREEPLWFTDFILHEDNDYTFRALLSAKRAGFVKQSFFLRRVRAESIMTKKTTFANAYGYFRSFLLMEQFLADKEFDDRTYEMISRILSVVLKNARKCWNALSKAERGAVYGMEEKERLRFKLLVMDVAEIEEESRQKEKTIQKIRNSKSYKLSRAIGKTAAVLRMKKK